jgi:dual specificity tyrosine-phosphorylation-regulated kinase 1
MFNDGFDDHDHNYIIQIGEIWDSRYRVLRVLGRGSFGQVVEALDLIDQQLYAVKIIKNRKAFFQQARVEITIVQYLNACDVNDSHNIGTDNISCPKNSWFTYIVRFKRFFEHKNHLCLVYELLSFNLYQMLRNGNFTGISLNLVRKFAAQLLIALRFLIANESKIIVRSCAFLYKY